MTMLDLYTFRTIRPLTELDQIRVNLSFDAMADLPPGTFGNINLAVNLGSLSVPVATPIFGSGPADAHVSGIAAMLQVAGGLAPDFDVTLPTSVIIQADLSGVGNVDALRSFRLSLDLPEGVTVTSLLGFGQTPSGAAPVPAPSTLLLLGSGLSGLVLLARVRR